MKERNVKKFNDNLSKLLNKVIRFNLSGPVLLQFTDEPNDEIGIIITHINLYDHYLTTLRHKVLKNDEFDIPQDDYTNFVEKQQNSILFPDFLLSSHKLPVFANEIEEKLCVNSFVVFPRSLKNILSSLNKSKENLFETIFITTKEYVEQDKVIKEKHFQFILKPNLPEMNTIMLVNDVLMESNLQMPMLPLKKMSKYRHPGFSRCWGEMVKEFNLGQENLLSILKLANVDLNKELSDNSYIRIQNKEKSDETTWKNAYIYKDFIKGPTKLAKIYSVHDHEFDCDMTISLLYIEYSQGYQYLFYRHLDMELTDLDNIVLKVF